jgi:hypothetical protein
MQDKFLAFVRMAQCYNTCSISGLGLDTALSRTKMEKRVTFWLNENLTFKKCYDPYS